MTLESKRWWLFHKGGYVGKNRVESSPGVLARIGGLLYLIIIAGGLFGEAFVRERLITSGNPTATAENIVSMELLWRSGVALELFMLSCAVALALIFYVLLRPVSKDLALLAAFFNLVSIAVEAANEQRLLGALFPLGNAEYLSAFQPEQLHGITSLSLKMYSHGFGISLIFFGWMCLVLGYLIFRSGYIPKVLGILMQLAGVSYLVNSFTLLLAPELANSLFPAILLPAFIGEMALCIWLLVKGVRLDKWKAQTEGRSHAISLDTG